jgi:type IV pilus assembly protein PilY1
LRPEVVGSTLADGILNLRATMTSPLSPASFASNLSPQVLNVNIGDCAVTRSSESACALAIMRWGVGLTNTEGANRGNSVMGGIFNSSPRIVTGPPGEFIRDEAYRRYAEEMRSIARSTVLYAPTVDGFLHAFKVASYAGDVGLSEENNEMWSFVPPAVLPVFKTQFPNTPAVLLDGQPVIAEVPAMISSGRTLLQRTPEVAQAGEGTYRTILVQNFGVGQVDGGYYALDITKPDLDDGGPRFLWQLTRDDVGHRLFGNGGTPLIATIALKVGPDVINTPVAILPGGNLGSPGARVTLSPSSLMEVHDETTYHSRRDLRAYSGAEEARSLTIVRLDTGEILRSFRVSGSAAVLDSSKVQIVDITSPIVGKPVAYPDQLTSNANRVYVGDRDGRLWRVDLSSSDPANWTMKVFFDAFFDKSWDEGQPVETPPLVSTNTAGEVVVAFSPGSQRVQPTPDGTINRVISLTDRFDTANNTFIAHVNWTYDMGCEISGCGSHDPAHITGERVTGPMSLFDGILYFATGIPGTDTPTVCSQPKYRLFGMHYTDPATPAPDNGGVAGLPGPPSTNPNDPPPLVQASDPQDGVVFGSTLTQTPSCFETQIVASDTAFGSGTRTRMTNITPGPFKLTFQVGARANQQDVPLQEIILQPPRSVTRISSWAAIFE